MADLGDIDFALRFRGVIEGIAEGLVGRVIPRQFSAEVISFDPFLHTALVRTAGTDTANGEADIQVKFSPQNQPSYGRSADGTMRGNIVTVSGTTGNYRISEVLDEKFANSGGLLPATTYAWDYIYFKWTGSFSYIGIGNSLFSSSGKFQIDMPPPATLVPVHGSSALTSCLVAANGFDLSMDGNYMSLWYEPTFQGTGLVSDPTKFHIVCTTAPFSIPASWIFIAARGDQNNGNSLKIGTGENFDHWREPAAIEYLNGWSQYTGSTFEKFFYRKVNTTVQFTGELNPGTNVADIFTLPVGFRPRIRQRLAPMVELKRTFGQSAGTAHYHTIDNVTAKIEVYPTGLFRCSDGQIDSTASYLSFYGLQYDSGG